MTFQKGGGRGRKSTRNTKVVEEEVDEKDKPYACDRELILIGHVTLVTITGTTIKSSHCYPFEDRAPVDFIHGCPILKWVAETWPPERVPG